MTILVSAFFMGWIFSLFKYRKGREYFLLQELMAIDLGCSLQNIPNNTLKIILGVAAVV